METSKVQIKPPEIASSPESRIDVCVATFKRPKLLKRLLQSLTTQETRGEFSYRIIVIDNDVGRSAEEIVNQFSKGNLKIIYNVEPQQNISLARNKALRLATGDYIAIIDDDDYAEKYWLSNLYRTLISHNADIVHGPVVAIVAEGTPEYVRKDVLFARPVLPTGFSDKYSYRTSNSLFRQKVIDQMKIPFDPDFGRTGGEDVVFFSNLKLQGCRFVWCNDAVVFETITAERANLFWILKRFFRNGNITYRMNGDLHENRSPDHTAVIFRSGARLVRLLFLLPFYTFAGIFHGESILKTIKIAEEIAFHAGFLGSVLNFRYEQYKPMNRVYRGTPTLHKENESQTINKK